MSSQIQDMKGIIYIINRLKVGLQLYSVRDAMAEDMNNTLKRVKEMDYGYVEFAGYFCRSAKEVVIGDGTHWMRWRSGIGTKH